MTVAECANAILSTESKKGKLCLVGQTRHVQSHFLKPSPAGRVCFQSPGLGLLSLNCQYTCEGVKLNIVPKALSKRTAGIRVILV